MKLAVEPVQQIVSGVDDVRLVAGEDRVTRLRSDLGGPPDVSWELAQVWPDAVLRVVDTGHAGGDAMTAANIEATNRFATLG
ncbi:MAG: hypothetical protein ACYCZV_07190 [Acidimicrobiales bacterium]